MIRWPTYHKITYILNISATYGTMVALPIEREVRLMVDQHVVPANPFSLPTHLTSGPASENMLIELCNSFTIANQSLK